MCNLARVLGLVRVSAAKVRRRVCAFLCWLLALFAACALPTDSAPVATPEPTSIALTPAAMRAADQGQIYALLANAHLLTVRQDGTTVADTALDPDSSSNSPRATGHYLALATDKRRAYVLVPLQPLAVDQIVAVNVGSAEIENNYALPDGVYHSIAVGPLTGHLFVFGNLGGGVIVTVIDPANGAPLSTWVARPEDGHTWTV
jgi:hypothetical protein